MKLYPGKMVTLRLSDRLWSSLRDGLKYQRLCSVPSLNDGGWAGKIREGETAIVVATLSDKQRWHSTVYIRRDTLIMVSGTGKLGWIMSEDLRCV